MRLIKPAYIFSESLFMMFECTDFSKYGGWGYFLATAGERIHPTIESDFGWKVLLMRCDVTWEMSYTNWGGKQPDYKSGDQACMAMVFWSFLPMERLPLWLPGLWYLWNGHRSVEWRTLTTRSSTCNTPDISVRILPVCCSCYYKRLLLLSDETLVKVFHYDLINYLLCNVGNVHDGTCL